jgi:hypothetical protein
MRTTILRPLTYVLLLLLSLLSPQFLAGQSHVLDGFETTAGWIVTTSEGAGLTLTSVPGKTGNALAMQFDLSKVSGYVIARKDFTIDLPANYQFVFDMRADAPVNNFEFKVMDENQNVHWIKKLNVTYPETWTRQRIKKRHLTFAWGPKRDAPLRSIRSVEFVVSVGNGGTGTVYLDNFRFEPIDDALAAKARPRLTATPATSSKPKITPDGRVITAWRSGQRAPAVLTVDFGYQREFGGFVIHWAADRHATSYTLDVSDDGREWESAFSTTGGNGGRDYMYLPEAEGRFVRLTAKGYAGKPGAAIDSITVQQPGFAASANDLFHTVAADAPRGHYPRYFQNEQTYWTVLGAPGDDKEALINEIGAVEPDKACFSIEPFIYVDGRLLTWQDVTVTPSLAEGYLPLPAVTWRYKDRWTLTIEPVVGGVAGNSILGIRYALEMLRGEIATPKLFLAIRPFQVNPPWQFLNTVGGVARIDSVAMIDGRIRVNERDVVPMSAPTAFGATSFASGEIVEYLARGVLPPARHASDGNGFASAALQYDFRMMSGDRNEVYVAVPFHGWRGTPPPNMPAGGASVYHTLMSTQTESWWRGHLNTIHFTVPPEAEPVIHTLQSNLAYIMINRDGPGIQPGSRSYERSWIRDGSLTATALLQTGHPEEVREFLDWYAKGQFPSGKIPCVIDARGPDAVPEHDSHGEFIYAIMQYFRYTNDTTWLRGKYDAVVKTVRFIQSLRAQRKTETYRNGTPEQRALYGLVPESISHEGYWDVPRHSYWDDFFILRGLKDAADMAAVLGERKDAAEFATERDDFRSCLYASMRLAMQNTKIDYIPGCAEIGDFDATSTTIGVAPGGELGNIPEPQLHNTFDKYFAYFQERKVREVNPNYTPYETRVIGTFVYLGQRKRVEETLNFFMSDRRPPAWNHWAEVVWRDPKTPKFIGDMPHTWVGSDFVRSVRAMFVYERERDTALVLGAGIPASWIASPTGVAISAFPTYYGQLAYVLKQTGTVLTVEVPAGPRIPSGGIVIAAPNDQPVRKVTVNGSPASCSPDGEIHILTLPASVTIEY